MRKKADRDPELANLRQPAPRVLASDPQKRSRRVYVSRLGFRSSSGNFRLTFLSCMLVIWLDRLSMSLNLTSHVDLWSRLPPVRFRRGSGEVPEKISMLLGLGSLERERERERWWLFRF
ncbi:hypothetical protein HanRHA438_Chr06g0264481 [Helianthus annuus]|nr:hypothetical protein HanIR_Chr06g0274661 [Helianthus annuus]KAJ0573267.1 hypothetical protein HanHA89_Chr06g0224861 [Helianthus annuus]KAJ0911559.1 hypothetical protein HanRHA438_Chr06g0264481 [Helianthus annuus]